MQPARIAHCTEREKVIAECVREVAADIRLIDLPDLVAHIKALQIDSVAMLVQSSVELWFKHGTLQFGQSGRAHLSWDKLPKIALDMEFHHQSVDAYFELVLEADVAAIDLSYIAFGDPSSDPEVNTSRLRDALLNARASKHEDAGAAVL